MNEAFPKQLRHLRFEPDRVEFTQDTLATVEETLHLLQSHPKSILEIRGHTDTVNTEEHNMWLSQSRADAVRNYLLARGIQAERITATGYGASRPVADNATAEGRWDNRRVELELIEPPSLVSAIIPPVIAAGVTSTARTSAKVTDFTTGQVSASPIPDRPARTARPALIGLALLLPAVALLTWWLWPKNAPDQDLSQSQPPGIASGVNTSSASSPAVTAYSNELHWIFFDFDKSALRKESRMELDNMAALLKDDANATAILKAYTDSKGSQEYNQSLSKRRASAAKEYLISKGIDPKRITITMSGEQNPVALNETNAGDSEQGRQLNRRVELYVIGGSGQAIVQSVPPDIPQGLKAK